MEGAQRWGAKWGVGNEAVGGKSGESLSAFVKCGQQCRLLEGGKHTVHPAHAWQWLGTQITIQIEKRGLDMLFQILDGFHLEEGFE